MRAPLIILMFAVFSYLFYKDGYTGYRNKNEQYVMYQLFTIAAPRKVTSEGMDEERWKRELAEERITVPTTEEAPLPSTFDKEQKWPSLLRDNYALLVGSSDGGKSLWTKYSGEKGWGEVPPEKLYDQEAINTQIYLAVFCGALAVIGLALFLRTLTRMMYVTDDAYVAPGGKVVPFSAMTRLDKRKWDAKGVAVIEYKDGDKTRKVKVDGMVYGQFDKSAGEPAEKLFSFILKNFKGELIEYEIITSAQEVSSSEQ